MENDFRALLATDATIIGLVAARIYPAVYAQNATDPAIRYQKITGAPGLHMRGSDGLSADLMQVDVRAATAAEVLSIRDAIVNRLHAFSGLQGPTDFLVIALRDDRGVKFEKTEPKAYYTASLDFDVHSRLAA